MDDTINELENIRKLFLKRFVSINKPIEGTDDEKLSILADNIAMYEDFFKNVNDTTDLVLSELNIRASKEEKSNAISYIGDDVIRLLTNHLLGLKNDATLRETFEIMSNVLTISTRLYFELKSEMIKKELLEEDRPEISLLSLN